MYIYIHDHTYNYLCIYLVHIKWMSNYFYSIIFTIIFTYITYAYTKNTSI